MIPWLDRSNRHLTRSSISSNHWTIQAGLSAGCEATPWARNRQYMKKTPNANNPAAACLLVTNSNGAVCNTVSDPTCFAPEWASVGYLNYQIDPKNFLSFRAESFDDIRSQRTGFRTRYTEAPAYNNGTKKSQLMFAADMIFFYSPGMIDHGPNMPTTTRPPPSDWRASRTIRGPPNLIQNPYGSDRVYRSSAFRASHSVCRH